MYSFKETIGEQIGSCVMLEQLWGDTPHPRAKEKPQQDGRRGEIAFRIKPHTCQRCSEGSKIPCPYQDPRPHRDWDRTVFGCLLWRYGSAVDCWGQELWVQQTWVWHKPSWRRLPLTHYRAAKTYTGLGKQTLGGHKQNLVCTRTQKKGAVTPHQADPDWPMCVQESLVEAWVSGPLLQGWGHSAEVRAWDLLKEVIIIIITSTIVCPQVNNREGTQPHPSTENSTENWIKDLLSMGLPIWIRPSFPTSQSLPSGSFHKPLILLHQRADRLKTTITEN